jgi:hypothetical protein
MFSTNRKLSKLLVSFLVMIFVFSQAPLIYGADEIDQYCSGPWGGWTTINGHSDISQTFTPTQNRLGRIGLVLKGDGNDTVYVRIQKNNTTIATGSTTEPSGSEVWKYIDFDDIELIPGDQYKIKLTTGGWSAGWYRSSSSGCSDSGTAYLDGTEKSYDWGFATWGHTYTAPEEPAQDDQPVVDDQQPNSEEDQSSDTDSAISEGSNQAPSTEVDFSIDPPSNLEASDVDKDQGGKIKLSWDDSSTSSIEGYLVFRSEQRDGEYKNIAKTGKQVLTYTDNVENEKSFYYFVRAYEGEGESASSNKAKATAIDNLAPEAPVNFLISSQLEDRLIFNWEANSEEDLDGYHLSVYPTSDDEEELDTVVKTIEIAKDETEYVLIYEEHDEINIDQDYQYYLQAKDTSNNLSERAGPITPTDGEESTFNRTSVWYISLIALAILLIILATLIYWEKKKQKKASKKKIKKSDK